MSIRHLLAMTTTLGLSLSLHAAPPSGGPKIPGVDEKVAEFIKAGEITGAVTLVATKDQIVHLSAVGKSNVAKDEAMREDALFWIASMTKPVTGVAVMMMVEEGKIALDDPAGKYIPELKGLKGPDGKAYDVTIRQMMSHTSGLKDVDSKEIAGATKLADLVPALAGKVLNFVPGTKWQYCQSSINMSGRIVEIASGMSFPEFVEKRITGPLGMSDTTFYLSQAQLGRLAPSYERLKDGTMKEVPIRFLGGKSPADRDRYPLANGGLFSTARDYVKFCQMVLNGGTFEGKQLLKPESVKEMLAPVTGELKAGFVPGSQWAVGWGLVKEPQGITGALSAGTYGHGGAYGTQAWIDPVKGRIYLLMIQRSNIGNSDGSSLRQAFQEAAAPK
ncbi:MAG TPA: serine hydrolase domain-containing protein [Tepidisphaeraceae bacterium]|nr:serine hydrolase domain-containing protein [Tepidisphaeraceae bacterium]